MVRHQDQLDEIEGDLQECEDATLPICMRVPYTPTAIEKTLHELTHIPFRNWCTFCVAGKAKCHPHQSKKTRKRGESTIPTWAMDYMFLDGSTPTLVSRDTRSRFITAVTLNHKGASDPWIAERIVEDIGMLGYGRMILKTDQEPAIKDLQKEVRQRRWDELKGITAAVRDRHGGDITLDIGNGVTILENSPAGESKANGFIERSIQEVEGQVKTVKAHIDHKIGKEIPRGHDLLTWLVGHSADSINRYAKGPDGRTAY